MHNRRGGQKIVNGHADLSALRDPNQGRSYLQGLALLAECIHLHTRTGVSFGVPVPLPEFEEQGKHTFLNLASWFAIGVAVDYRGRSGDRGRRLAVAKSPSATSTEEVATHPKEDCSKQVGGSATPVRS